MPPARHLAPIRTYVAAVVGCRPDDIVAVRRFEEGNRHEVFKVSYARGSQPMSHVVVRVSLTDDADERAQAEREASVLTAVGGRGAPRLVDFSPAGEWFDTPVMSMEFVPGRRMALAEVGDARVERLGRLVAGVHREPLGGLIDALGEEDDLACYAATRLRSTLAGLKWLDHGVDAAIQAHLRDVASALQQAWDRWRHADSFVTGETLALLHGDIAFGNVLWAPDPVLIDWEYTRLGDPADEIAYLFDQNGLAPSSRGAFWRGYRALGNEVDIAQVVERVRWWEPLALLGSTLWWVERWVRRTEADAAATTDPAATREPSYYLDKVDRRLRRLGALSDRTHWTDPRAIRDA